MTSNYGYYQPRGFQQYVSRDPSARTKATFHVIIDPRNVDTGSEVVCINGGPEVLGKWDVNTGCPLTMDAANPFIWRGEVELPYLPHEFCQQGIFEFKCGLLKNGGHKAEKGRRRRTKRMQSHYFLYALYSRFIRPWTHLDAALALSLHLPKCLISIDKYLNARSPP